MASKRVLVPVIAAVLAAVAAVLVLTVFTGEDAEAQTVRFQDPMSSGPDPFTEPADVRGRDTVELETVGEGPFGGTGSDLVCDRELLIRSLKARPDRLREWARVVGVSPDFERVADYIRELKPVTLTRDTRVTNHSFVNGRAVGFQAILQAGTAVLVDEKGVPVARCRCGNPLTEPVFVPEAKCLECPPNYQPPPPCKRYRDCYKRYPSPPPVKGAGRQRPKPEDEPEPGLNPSASFSPNPGRAGDAFTLSLTGFSPNATVTVTLVRPDGVTEDYPVRTDGNGSGAQGFPPDPTVITGTYTATAVDPSGQQAVATVEVGPAESEPPPSPEPEPPETTPEPLPPQEEPCAPGDTRPVCPPPAQ